MTPPRESWAVHFLAGAPLFGFLNMKPAFAILLVVGMFFGCKTDQSPREEAYRAKMRLVVDEAIRQTQDPIEKEEFRSGKVFVKIEGLDMPLVGVSVLVGKSKLDVSFMLDYFESNDVPVLAKDALRDFRRAVVGQGKDKH